MQRGSLPFWTCFVLSSRYNFSFINSFLLYLFTLLFFLFDNTKQSLSLHYVNIPILSSLAPWFTIFFHFYTSSPNFWRSSLHERVNDPYFLTTSTCLNQQCKRTDSRNVRRRLGTTEATPTSHTSLTAPPMLGLQRTPSPRVMRALGSQINCLGLEFGILTWNLRIFKCSQLVWLSKFRGLNKQLFWLDTAYGLQFANYTLNLWLPWHNNLQKQFS